MAAHVTDRRASSPDELRVAERFMQLAERAGTLECDACGRLGALRRPTRRLLCGRCWRDELAVRADGATAPRAPLTASVSEHVNRKKRHRS